jgi:ADP-dependent NAD(P)H-hydrate dehydratase
LTDVSNKIISSILFDMKLNAIGIGPGLGQDKITEEAFHAFLKWNTVPLVIDADALNILAKNKEWFSLLPPQTVLTPHPKELERLVGNWDSEVDKLEKVTKLSSIYDLIIVVKGAPTNIVDKEKVYINTTGNQALATAGSGDVLTGIISSLLAQSYTSLHAALLGVYLHGLTADLAVNKTSYPSFIASDIIEHLGAAFLELERMKMEYP